MVTHNPLYGSGQAGLPHPALTSSDNAQAAQGIRMTSAGGRQPAADQAPHPVLEHAGFLTAPQERAMPEPTYLDVVKKRREPHLLILTGCLSYPLQRTGRVRPARCPGRVLLWQGSFWQNPFLP